MALLFLLSAVLLRGLCRRFSEGRCGYFMFKPKAGHLLVVADFQLAVSGSCNYMDLV